LGGGATRFVDARNGVIVCRREWEIREISKKELCAERQFLTGCGLPL
jgi:hypothetical protein